jgi:hypothetical protein
MVMSTPVCDSRPRCMRCGNIALRAPSGGISMLPAVRRFMNWPTTNLVGQRVTTNQQIWTRELIGEGSHI